MCQSILANVLANTPVAKGWLCLSSYTREQRWHSSVSMIPCLCGSMGHLAICRRDSNEAAGTRLSSCSDCFLRTTVLLVILTSLLLLSVTRFSRAEMPEPQKSSLGAFPGPKRPRAVSDAQTLPEATEMRSGQLSAPLSESTASDSPGGRLAETRGPLKAALGLARCHQF